MPIPKGKPKSNEKSNLAVLKGGKIDVFDVYSKYIDQIKSIIISIAYLVVGEQISREKALDLVTIQIKLLISDDLKDLELRRNKNKTANQLINQTKKEKEVLKKDQSLIEQYIDTNLGDKPPMREWESWNKVFCMVMGLIAIAATVSGVITISNSFMENDMTLTENPVEAYITGFFCSVILIGCLKFWNFKTEYKNHIYKLSLIGTGVCCGVLFVLSKFFLFSIDVESMMNGMSDVEKMIILFSPIFQVLGEACLSVLCWNYIIEQNKIFGKNTSTTKKVINPDWVTIDKKIKELDRLIEVNEKIKGEYKVAKKICQNKLEALNSRSIALLHKAIYNLEQQNEDIL